MQPGLVRMVASCVVALIIDSPVNGKSKMASDYFTLCHRNDPDIGGCIKNSIESAKPQLIKGIPELKLPTLDPLFIPEMQLREGEGNFLFQLKMKNLTITGLKDFTVEKAEANVQKGTWTMHLKTPHLHFDADYEMNGRVLALPLVGNGHNTFDFYGVKTTSNVVLKNVTRDGKVYGEVDSITWTIDVEDSKSYFSNLFNGDKSLGETTNKFLNENWREAFETYKHLPEEAFAEVFRGLNNRFFGQFPIDELYPE